MGLLAVVPATLHLIVVARHRSRWTTVAGSAAVLLALVGVAWFAVAFGLLAPSVSY